MKKILIPTDFSTANEKAIDAILKLFKHEVCEFYFLHAYSFSVNGLDALELLHADEEWYEKPKQESESKLGKLIERCISLSKVESHNFHAITECSSLVNAVKKHQAHLGVDLVLLTSGGNKKVEKTNDEILNSVRDCPILIIPSNVKLGKRLNLTIASNFKQKLNNEQLDQFRKSLGGLEVEIGILVLEEEHKLSEQIKDNLEAFMLYLSKFQNAHVDLKYAKTNNQLKAYAQSHRNEIMCVVDKKPNFFRKIGLFKSDVILKLKQLNTNTVLTLHQ
ncbi:universal stress protein [Meridianimaribacter flavus]